jgi:hypothetical protein
MGMLDSEEQSEEDDDDLAWFRLLSSLLSSLLWESKLSETDEDDEDDERLVTLDSLELLPEVLTAVGVVLVSDDLAAVAPAVSDLEVLLLVG